MIETILDKPHWHGWRRTGIGASEAAAVAGVSRRPTRMDIWLDKVGPERQPDPPNEQMRWGHRLEDDIADAYSEATGIAIRETQVCCRSDGHPWMIATVDGVADDRLVEFKAVGMWAMRELGESGDTDTLPAGWILQVQHQMEAHGSDRCDVAVFLPTLELRVYPVERSPILVDSLMEIEAEFWSFVTTKQPPPALDPGDAEALLRVFGNTETRIDLSHDMCNLLDLYEQAREQIKQAERTKEQVRARLIAALGHHKYGDLPDGRSYSVSVSERMERTQVVRAHTEVRLNIKARRTADINTD